MYCIYFLYKYTQIEYIFENIYMHILYYYIYIMYKYI